MTDKLRHFLLVFDHHADKLVLEDAFDDADTAVARYFDLEDEYRDKELIEIVLIGSDSIETVRLTHANYYDGTAGISKYLVGL